ncbi:MAG: hypothetical protein ACON5F_05970 [Jejuia sp.]
MGMIEAVVNSLEHKINKVLLKLDQTKQANLKLNEELINAKEELKTYQKQNANWEEKYQALKMANSMLGSNDNKRETKLKINALIREIDHCIAQLSE